MALTRSIGAYDDGTALAPGLGTTPLDTRKSLSALWASAGVVAGGPSPLVTGTAGFAYSVAGPVPFVTTRGPSDGFHMFTNDGAVTVPITNAAGVTLAGAPGSGLQRIDIVWVQHRSNTENSDTTSAPRFGVESGAAVSSGPVAPSLPAGALELARNTMLSTATSTTGTGNLISQTAAVATMRASVADTGWVNPANAAYSNSWVNGSGNAKPFGYRIVGNRIQFRGSLTSGGSGTTAIRIAAAIPAQTFVIPLVGLTLAATTTAADPRAFLSMAGTSDAGLGDLGIYFTSVSGLAYFGFDGISVLLG